MEPTLLPYELLETLRVEVEEDGRDETVEDESEVSRDEPASEVALTKPLTSLELGGAGAGLAVSPALSARVFLLSVFAGGGIVLAREFVAEADISKSFPGVGMLLGGRMPEVNCGIR